MLWLASLSALTGIGLIWAYILVVDGVQFYTVAQGGGGAVGGGDPSVRNRYGTTDEYTITDLSL